MNDRLVSERARSDLVVTGAQQAVGGSVGGGGEGGSMSYARGGGGGGGVGVARLDCARRSADGRVEATRRNESQAQAAAVKCDDGQRSRRVGLRVKESSSCRNGILRSTCRLSIVAWLVVSELFLEHRISMQ